MLNYKNLPLLLFPVAGVNFSKKEFWHTPILFLYLVLMRYTLCVWLHLRYNPSPITRVRHYLYCMYTLKVRRVHTNIDCLSHLCNVEIKEFSWNPNSIWKQYVFTDNCICRITLFLWAERGKGQVVSLFYHSLTFDKLPEVWDEGIPLGNTSATIALPTGKDGGKSVTKFLSNWHGKTLRTV